MLSISTIASAIADASISTDPSELAAMIMELSKRGRKRSQPLQEGLKSTGPAVKFAEEPQSHEQARTFFTPIYYCNDTGEFLYHKV